jgi:hypothetical protein
MGIERYDLQLHCFSNLLGLQTQGEFIDSIYDYIGVFIFYFLNTKLIESYDFALHRFICSIFF